jgi:hypothetical protein
MLTKAEKPSFAGISEEIFHRAYVGEAINLIYLPLYLEKGALFDAITHRPWHDCPKTGKIFIHHGKRPALGTQIPGDPLPSVRMEPGRPEGQRRPALQQLSVGLGSATGEVCPVDFPRG